MSKIDLRPLLECIPPAACSYEEWINVGMALCHEGYSVDVWNDWSRKDPERYHDGECHKNGSHSRGIRIRSQGRRLLRWRKITDGNRIQKKTTTK